MSVAVAESTLPGETVSGPRPQARIARAACFVACIGFAAAVLVQLHNRQWNPYDDGTYLHLADRVARGEVLHRDVQDIHLGYINFANALALKVFGDDAVSLRYPLVLMGLANAALAFWLLADAGTAAATVGSLAITGLSYVQFMNPSAHWYAMFLTLATAGAMTWLPRGAMRHFWLGLLVGLVVLFRQLTGAFVAAPVLLYLLLELPQDERRRRAWAAKAMVAVLGLGLAAYLVRKTDPVALLTYGVWPLAILLWGFTRVAAANKDAARMLLRFSLGGAVAALPLVAYHVYQGSVGPWLNDTVVGAMSLTRLEFIDDLKYWMNMMNGARAVVRPSGFGRALIGLFWLVAPVLPGILGLAVTWTVWRSRVGGSHGAPQATAPPVAPLALLPVFYFLVSLHYQKWMYFFFGVPLTVIGLLSMASAARAGFRWALNGTIGGLTAIALILIAAPFPRLVPGGAPPLVRDHGIPRCSIWLDPSTADVYRNIQNVVDRSVRADESILALPVHPELYYLTARRNPTRFYNAALGLRSSDDVRALVRSFDGSPPRVVFFNPTNHYNTAQSRELMEWVAQRYDNLGQIGAFQVYRYRHDMDQERDKR